MAKRKRHALAADHSDDVVSADFGSFEIVKGYYHAHPIYKSIHVASAKKFYDLFAAINVPRGQRSSRGGRREKKLAMLDDGRCVGSVVKEPRKSRVVMKESRKSRVVKHKQKAAMKSSGCVLVGTRSVCNGRVSRRLRGRTIGGQNTGKLGSGKFEEHIEGMWRELSEEKKNEFAYLNSLWFSLYVNGAYKEKVLSWIKKKDIFSKKYVFVPIVLWGHWFLLILCHFGEDSEAKSERRCMLLLDSLQEAHSKQLEPKIRRFVSDIFKTEERPETTQLTRKLPLFIPKVPQQKNGEECGFFVLYYINQFLKSASDDFTFSKGCTHFMKEDWFTPEDVECFVKLLDSMAECSNYSD